MPDLDQESNEALAVLAQSGNLEARNLCVTRNMGFIVKVIKRTIAGSRYDYVQPFLAVGVMKFIDAIEHFDPTRGYRLTSYAYRAIRTGLIADRNLWLYGSKKVTDHCFVTMESDWSVFTDRPGSENPVEAAELAEQIAALKRAIPRLKPRGRYVLNARMAGDTLEVIGKRMGRTKECVRQIEMRCWAELAAIMRKLR